MNMQPKKQIKDKYITDIDFVDSYVKELKYKGKRFTIYAYQFKDDETAKEYYSRVVGRANTSDIDCDQHTGLFSSRFISRYKTNVYRIKVKAGGTLNYLEIMKYLNSVFDVTIRE